MSKSRLRFEVRSAFSQEILPFIKDVEPYFKEVNDSIPIIPHLEKSKGFQKRNFGKAPASTYRVVDKVKNIVELGYGGDQKVLAYQKVIHLLDAYKHLRYGDVYSDSNRKSLWSSQDLSFMNEPNNQAYVDVASSFLASSIHEQFGSPHFAKFYQAFRSLPDTYKLHVTDDISSYRFSNWFWQAFDKGIFTLEVREKGSDALLTNDEVLQLLRPSPDMCCDSSSDGDSSSSEDSEDSNESDNSINAEVLDEQDLEDESEVEMESVDNFECENESAEIINRGSSHTRNKDQDSDDSEFDAYVIHAILKSMPVIVMHTELMSGNMDELLEQEDFEDGWSDKWTAWLFQVIVALQQLQTHFNLVHNDLHTNNILWKNTDQEYFYYKLKNGKKFKIPTYGKRFTVIDFGRATLVFNGVDIASSDFRDGADAEGQYNYGSWRNKDEPIIKPNPSFDLCRLSCSLTRVLFPKNPDQKHEDATIITKDGKTIIKETNNELFNMLWTWLSDDKKHSVLEDGSGDERFLGFDLYQHIAQYCHNALPSVWLEKPIFRKYNTDADETYIQV
jgi:thiamine kinase-like enzyme